MPGGHVDKILRRVQSFTKRSPQEIVNDIDTASTKVLKSDRSKSGSARMGVFAVLKKSSVPTRTKSLSRLDSLPGDIPQGCLAVYVGKERRRFVISTKYLRHDLFKALLKKCEEEFGFNYQGGLTIVCDPVLFEHLLWLIGTNNPIAKTAQLDELLNYYDYKVMRANEGNCLTAYLGVS